MVEVIAITIAGLVAPFFTELIKWLEKKFVGSVVDELAALGLAAFISALATLVAMVATQTPFEWADFLYDGSLTFTISTAVFHTLIKPTGLRVGK